MNVVLFSRHLSHIKFAEFLALKTGAVLMFSEDLSTLDKNDINLIPDYLASPSVSDSIILDTGLRPIPKFKTFISNLDSSSEVDYNNFLLQLGLLDFSKTQTLTLKESHDKYSVLTYFKDLLASSGTNSQVSGDIVQVLDEMLMNALFDAQNLNIPRSANFKLERPVSVVWEIKDSMLYFNVIDRWGSLDKTSIVKHLTQNTDHYKVDASYHGAGLGLYRSFFLIGSSMKFSSVPGHSTSVECLFNLKKRTRDFKKQLKFISV